MEELLKAEDIEEENESSDRSYLRRTLKIEFAPTGKQKALLDSMLAASRYIYNQLIEHLHYKRQEYRRVKELDPQCQPHKIDDYVNVLNKGWAQDLTRTFANQEYCVWPRETKNKPAKQGKKKGEERIVTVVCKGRKPEYGMPAQSAGIICRTFEAAIKGCFTHRKNGNTKAELPKRFKSYYPLPFSSQAIKLSGDRLTLGAKPYILKLRVPELINKAIAGDIKISKSRSGRYYLHVCTKLENQPNPELTNVAAVDFGQKRAMVLSLPTGETASISGKDILGLKRERDRRYREINRRRSRILKGQIRQYLSPEEKDICRKLQEKDNERQWQGKTRRGGDAKYAHRIINQRRKELGLRKRSRKERKIQFAQNKAADYYRVRLTYANHCISRAAIDWAVENKVGTIYVGDLDSLPKGRKKGKRRIRQVGRNNIWEMPTQVKYLEEKLELAGGSAVEVVSERYSSQTCPNCGARHKPKNRIYKCRSCGWRGDRDGVGAANILSSVLLGVCGKIIPLPLRTLPIAPAIGQRFPMRRAGGNACELVEEVAKESGVRTLQASGDCGVKLASTCHRATLTTPRTTRKPLSEGRTQARGGEEVLANAGTSDSIGFVTPVAEPQLPKTGVKPKSSNSTLKNQPERYVQLSLWDLPCDDLA